MTKTKSFVIGLIIGIVTVIILSILLISIFGHVTTK